MNSKWLLDRDGSNCRILANLINAKENSGQKHATNAKHGKTLSTEILKGFGIAFVPCSNWLE